MNFLSSATSTAALCLPSPSPFSASEQLPRGSRLRRRSQLRQEQIFNGGSAAVLAQMRCRGFSGGGGSATGEAAAKGSSCNGGAAAPSPQLLPRQGSVLFLMRFFSFQNCAIWHDRAGGERKAAGCRRLLAAVAVGSPSPLSQVSR